MSRTISQIECVNILFLIRNEWKTYIKNINFVETKRHQDENEFYKSFSFVSSQEENIHISYLILCVIPESR